MRNLLVILPLLAAVLTTSCKKNTGLEATPTATIEITAPYSNQVYQQGDTTFIKATITADITLHGYEISIVDRNTGIPIYQKSNHAHATKLYVAERWVNPSPGGVALRLHISTSIDHEGRKVDKFVDFTTQPN